MHTAIDAFKLMRAAEPAMGACRLEAKARVRFALAQALAQGRVEFHYQPVVQAKNGRPAFFEMLARLRLSDGRVLPAGAFLPAVEDGELGRAIDRLALAQALRALAADPGLRVSVNMSPRSMGALWLAGFEDDPEQLQCGELCVVEIFGRSAVGASCEVGMGIKAFRDPALTQDFDAPRLPTDVADFHTYAVDWNADVAVFSVDDEQARRCPNPPTYPMQLMVTVYDFPEWSVGDDDHLVPELVVDWISG